MELSQTKDEISGCMDAVAMAKEMLQKNQITEEQYNEVYEMSRFVALHLIEPAHKHDCHCNMIEIIGHLQCENVEKHISHEWKDPNGSYFCEGIETRA